MHPHQHRAAPPILKLSRHHWNEIVNRGSNYEDTHRYRMHESELAYQAYLREESRKMTASWENSVERIHQRKTEERDRRQKEKREENETAIRELKERQKRYQQEQIENVEESMKQLKPGPKLLKSAHLLTDVLKVQNEQRHFNVLQNIQNRQQRSNEGHDLDVQSRQWIHGHQVKERERQARTLAYKSEIRQMIEGKEVDRRVEFDRREKQNLSIKAAMDEHCRREVEKEKRDMERRREQMRQTATEAMRMAEQRRLRDKMEEEVASQVNEIYLDGKSRIEEMKSAKYQQIKDDQARRQSLVRVQMESTMNESQEQLSRSEFQSQLNASMDFTKKLEDREKADLEKKKRLKAQRIQYHVEEMERQRQQKGKEERLHMESVLNRLLNDSISSNFNDSERKRRIQESQALRTKLMAQWEEKQSNARAQKSEIQRFTNENCDFSKDHREFIEFAAHLIEQAKAENKSQLPLAKAVNQYRAENFVERKPLLPHLEVNFPVYYKRPNAPENAKIRYNIDQLKALNSKALES